MSVVIIGSNGSMGKRYQAILRYLGRKFECLDVGYTKEQLDQIADRSTGIIIATPTDTHAQLLKTMIPFGKPILCEKPITKDIAELKQILDDLRRYSTPFRMMLQYEMLVDSSRIGPSLFDYFRHGNDGLIWDCTQIIGLARGKVELRESSPVWACKINGQGLNIAHMDAAYIAYVQKWFQKPRQDLFYLEALHEKVKSSELKAQNG